MKPNLFLVIFFSLLFNVPFGQTQVIYTGQVSDVATGKHLENVTIELQQSTINTQSNYFGDFVLVQNSAIPTPTQKPYQFYYNTILWDHQLALSLAIYTIDGKMLYQMNTLGDQGVFIFPKVDFGVYIIQVKAENDIQYYKAYSNGRMLTVVDDSANRHQHHSKPEADTLIFSTEGYYPRTVILPGKDTVVHIKMLKGNYDDLHYFNELLNPIAFDLISGAPARSNFGEVKSVKFIYDTRDELMYYMNTKRYELHYTFARNILGYNQGLSVFNQTQYLDTSNRFLLMGSLNYHQALDKYIMQFVSANEMDCATLKLLFDKILATSYIEKKLFLFANREEWDTCESIQKISPDELFEGQNYQALNLTKNYGYLTKVHLEDLEHTYVGRHDLILLNGIPNDVPVVAGIITTAFQTPLSHINVLSHGRGTPNMALRDGWENPQLDSLIGKLVYLNVQADSFFIRKATLEEATTFWDLTAPQDSVYLDKDTELQGLVDLEAADYSFVDRIGGKAANFAELLNIKIGNLQIPTPETSFAIPFYYYEEHIREAGLETYITLMLQNDNFKTNPAVRQVMLEVLQDKLIDHPVNPDLVNLVLNRIHHFNTFSAFRFRSSTNAEDLEGFSGAGLYSSHSAKKDDPIKTVERVIKKVWASLWNFRAFEERSYFKIDHHSCAMGILVHRSFPDEDANGVLITKNLYNQNPGFIVNVQHGEHSIVFPEPGVLHDQFILFTWSVDPEEDFMIEYLTFSNVPELMGKPGND